MKKLYLFLLYFIVEYASGQGSLNCPNTTIIGTTYVENQANYGSPGRIIYEWPDQTMAAVWVIGFNHPIYQDRGTGYNFFNGAWNSAPSTRLEQVRTNFPNIVGNSAFGEHIFTHSFSLNYNQHKLYRSNNGTGPWVEDPLTFMEMIWAKFAIGGSNGQYIHLIGNKYPPPSNGQEYSMRYWRSPDLGNSWDLQDILIPQLDSNNTLLMIPEKNISCRGDVVAIVTGGFTDDLILTKSTDNGNSWTNTIINQFPIPLYNQGPMISDVNNDGIADTVTTVDGSKSIVIDSNNMVHVWAAKTKVWDPDTFQVNTFGYFPHEEGVLYWNESMGPNAILGNEIAVLEDIDNDGYINLPALDSLFSDNCSATSMVTAGINEWNHLFVAYAAFVEDTINPIPTVYESRRNIYIMKSVDNGLTWSVPYRPCPEQMVWQKFPSMTEYIYDDPRIIFFRDTMGHTEPDPHHLEVVYLSPDISTSVEENDIKSLRFKAWQSKEHSIIISLDKNLNYHILKISITEICGRAVKNLDFPKIENSSNIEIDMGDSASSIYFINIQTKQNVASCKILYMNN